VAHEDDSIDTVTATDELSVGTDTLAPLPQAIEHDDDPRLLDLCRGLSFDEFYPVFQSVVQLSNGRTVGAEALARWAHPIHGTVLPDAFVPLADASGLLAALGGRILAGACARLAEWQALGRTDTWVSVNLTERQLASSRLHAEVMDAIRRHRLLPGTLVLEICEATVADNGESVVPLMRVLRRTGANIALSNACTGRLTPARIASLPLDMVKIDRSVVAELPDSVPQRARLKGMLELFAKQGLLTVSEGVERVVERDALASLGCPLAQGFLFSSPTRSPDFDR
jgi:EAL domain-containing protein (putative c-di-GMP-specific phosphodiesterase class I)